MVKFTYFCIIDSFSGSSDGKINYFKMLYNNFFFYKTYMQMSKTYHKEYRDNITDEQEQKRREAIRQYQKKYRDNMTDEQKQKQGHYQVDYRKKYYAAKKLNKIINDNKIIDDNDNKIIDDNDNDFYCISIIIKLKKYIVPI